MAFVNETVRTTTFHVQCLFLSTDRRTSTSDLSSAWSINPVEHAPTSPQRWFCVILSQGSSLFKNHEKNRQAHTWTNIWTTRRRIVGWTCFVLFFNMELHVRIEYWELGFKGHIMIVKWDGMMKPNPVSHVFETPTLLWESDCFYKCLLSRWRHDAALLLNQTKPCTSLYPI